MPIPETTNIGTVIKFLQKDKPTIDHRQMVAIALSVARKAKEKKEMSKHHSEMMDDERDE